MKLEPGDQLQLSDGHTYLFLFPLILHNQEYMIFSCREVEGAYRLGKFVKDGDEEKLSFITDEKLLREVYKYVHEHADEL